MPQNDQPVALTIGEPGGIGPELTLKVWSRRRENDTPPFILVGDCALLEARAKLIGENINIQSIEVDDIANITAAHFNEALPVLAIAQGIVDKPGIADPVNARAVIDAIKTAVKLVANHTVSAVVTNPIQKKALYDAGFHHPGHTEYLGALASDHYGGAYKPVMMLAGPLLKTVPATVHIPLQDVTKQLNTSDLIETIATTHKELVARFSIANPCIVVTGLNPHAGEDGAMGSEDAAIILPAVEACQNKGMHVTGPHPADTLFHAERRQTYDAAIAMYHDQALIPVKTLGFDETVNVTLGLPFVRTSPDHGTALDIAGKGIASEISLLNALKMAAMMTNGREAGS